MMIADMVVGRSRYQQSTFVSIIGAMSPKITKGKGKFEKKTGEVSKVFKKLTIKRRND
jgi:hypothetical protein